MKIFEINATITLPAVEELTLRNGITIPIISLGDRQAGSHFVPIPLKGITPSEKTQYISDVFPTLTRSGKLSFIVGKTVGAPATSGECDASEEIYLLVKCRKSYRGSSYISSWSGLNPVLEGGIALSPSHRLGYKNHYLLRLRPSQIADNPIRLGSDGRQTIDDVIFYEDGKIQILSVEEYKITH